MADREVKFKDLKVGDHVRHNNDGKERLGVIIFAKPVKFEDKDSISIGIESSGAVFSLVRPLETKITVTDDTSPEVSESHGIALDT